ncbi:MAG: thioredoxin-like domain-containing protein [Planctomycetota bacterium]
MHQPSRRPIRRTAATALLLAAFAMPATPAIAQPDRPEPTIQTLLDRPDLRPATVAAQKDFNFGNGDRIAKGTELAVYELSANSITLDSGAFIFEAKHEDTDLLERTVELIEGLSDEALALTFESLQARSEFWPVRVAVTQTLDFGGGLVIAAGTELPLRTIANGQIEAVYLPAQQPITLAAEQTDLIARAREIASRETASPPRPHFVRSIEAALDPESAAPALVDAEYVLVYRGREGCSRCARLTPELKKAYRKLKQNHTNFEFVFVSDDRSEQSFNQYVSKAHMPWKVVPYTNVFAAANTRSLPGRMLPVVYLMSPDGTVIDSTENGSAGDVLKTLERELRG